MSIKIIQSKLEQFQAQTPQEEQNALKEITQEVALSGLSRAGFFKKASFQGGTCLRIFYGLARFSEDLDFALHTGDKAFDWMPYLQSLKTELESYGYQIQVQDRSTPENAVKAGFLKDDSIGKILVLKQHSPMGMNKSNKPLKIKLEIDTNPPAGAVSEQKYTDFPVTVPVLVHDLPSLFAGKSHALLCRGWEKGRDWFDFNWYVGRKIELNYELLSKALNQVGPWKGQGILVTKRWYINNMRDKINSIQWEKQKQDISRFLKQRDLANLNLWSTEFFLNRLQSLEENLKG